MTGNPFPQLYMDYTQTLTTYMCDHCEDGRHATGRGLCIVCNRSFTMRTSIYQPADVNVLLLHDWMQGLDDHGV